MGRQCSVKITVIGVGHVGSAVGFVLATRGLAREIVLCARDGEEGRSPPPPVGPVPALQPARWPRCRRVEAVTGNVPQLGKAERKVVAARSRTIPGIGRSETPCPQELAEEVELAAEVVPSLLEVGLGPEEVDEPLAGVGMPGVIGEIGQQRRRLLAREREGGRVSPAHPELAQQLNPPTSFHPLPRWRRPPAGGPAPRPRGRGPTRGGRPSPRPLPRPASSGSQVRRGGWPRGQASRGGFSARGALSCDRFRPSREQGTRNGRESHGAWTGRSRRRGKVPVTEVEMLLVRERRQPCGTGSISMSWRRCWRGTYRDGRPCGG
jgi:hypothetical protein